jgi:DNA-binding CsgD family transcriptional regulator
MSTVAALARSPHPHGAVSIFPTPPKQKAPAPANRNRVGLILLDASLKPIYCNSAARSILGYPAASGPAVKIDLSRRMRSIILGQPGINESPSTAILVSGRRRYRCRCFTLETDAIGGRPSIAVTLERDDWTLYDLISRFHLTEREVEAVRHLTEGLTSKEIAERMGISPNTVKTYFRCVMFKMGVTTRSGVIGKLVSSAQFRQ